MGVFAYIKNGTKYKNNQFPGAYPASRVSYNGSDVETELDKLNADKSNDIITDEVTSAEESVSANTIKIFQTTCTKTGYTPLGVVSYTVMGTYNDEVTVYRIDFNADKSKVNVGVRNMHSGANSLSVKTVILYKKN